MKRNGLLNTKGFIIGAKQYAYITQYAASIYNPSFYKMAPMDDGEPP